jgi:hypothetical protein
MDTSGVDFVAKLMAPAPEERMMAKEALTYNWTERYVGHTNINSLTE